MSAMKTVTSKFLRRVKMNTTSSPAASILLEEWRGTYIPHEFALFYNMDNWHVSEENRRVLAEGIENKRYWEVWDEVLRTAYYEKKGFKWRLYQDGPLFAYCQELMTDKEKADFFQAPHTQGLSGGH